MTTQFFSTCINELNQAFSRRGISILLFISFLGVTQQAIAQFAGGSGTEAAPYQVATADQLNDMRDHMDAWFIQTADIDLDVAPYNSGSGWEPVGTSANRFTGTFDGNGFTISNLYINRGSENIIGLFGYTSGAAITNTGLTNVDVTGKANTGGLVGWNQGGSAITNSYAAGMISGNSETGGLVGFNFGSFITNSYAAGTVSGNGGLVGFTYGGSITNSYAAGTVSGGSYTGGLVGTNYNGVPITNSYWNTETSGQASSAGGTGLTTAQMTQQASFTGFDFSSVWSIGEGAGYPFLQIHGYKNLYISGDEGWRMLTSPVSGTSFATLLDTLWTQGFTGADTETGASNVYTWNETTQSWGAPSDASDIPSAGTGFLVYVYDDQDYDGTPDGFPKTLVNQSTQFTGPASPTLTYTDTEDLPNDGWNLVGNPYGTTVNWDAETGWTRENLDDTYYIWNNDAGEYQSYNGFTGTTALENGLIAPWQGFWVKANAADPSLSLTDDVRSAGGIFLKEKPTPQLTFTLSGTDRSSSTVIMLSENASADKDPLDAYKLQSLNENYLSLFSELKDGTTLDINALPSELEEPLELSLDFDGSDLSGEFELGWNLEAFPDDWQFSLRDNVTSEEVDVREQSTISFELAKGKSSKVSKTLEDSEKELHPPHGVIPPKVMKSAGKEIPHFTLTILSGNAVSNEPGDGLPSDFGLNQNYPNPFNPATVIRYQLPVNSAVRLEVFDMVGRKVSTLVDGQMKAGTHQVTFDARDLSSGMYIYRLVAADKVITKKLTLIK